MDKNVLARNILILSQLDDIASAFAATGVRCALLKGAALILSFPSYAKTRNMEDIDLLIPPGQLAAAKEALSRLGYRQVPEDHAAMSNPALTAPVDILDGFWYLSKKENEAVFNGAFAHPLQGFAGCLFHLKPEDFYIHVLAHGALHHAEVDKRWKDDLSLIWDNWGKTMNWAEVEGKLKSYGFQKAVNTYLSPELAEDSFYLRMLRSQENPFKGHITRAMFLPFMKKLAYLRSALFPSGNFLSNRYDLKTRREIMLYAFLRPFLFLKSLALFAKRMLF